VQKKLIPNSYDTDKSQQYLDNYEGFFRPLAGQKITLLELGVKNGGSLLLWRDYFVNGTIVGTDMNPVKIDDPTGRIHFYSGFQQDTAFIDNICNKSAPEGFDVIIDDCSHIGEFTRISFWRLFNNFLKPGGIYVIEDWGTGYWDMYPDGKRYNSKYLHNNYTSLEPKLKRIISDFKYFNNMPLLKNLLNKLMIKVVPRKFPNHNFGMVGFIKTLVDECGMADITHQQFGIPPQRQSKFKNMQISHGQVFIVKASES
jgi:SAM-dependent methyltransferase